MQFHRLRAINHNDHTLVGNFAINSATGVLTVRGDLDHENITQYSIVVQAREDIGDRTTTPDTVCIYNYSVCHVCTSVAQQT